MVEGSEEERAFRDFFKKCKYDWESEKSPEGRISALEGQVSALKEQARILEEQMKMLLSRYREGGPSYGDHDH
jgi:hypothetical protein